jgi:hypothetical protein
LFLQPEQQPNQLCQKEESNSHKTTRDDTLRTLGKNEGIRYDIAKEIIKRI